MGKILRSLLFFVGWVLSPFTWWNDTFVNIPLSYLMANILFYATQLSFGWLMIGSYWVTNILGMLFMYLGGKHLIVSSKNKIMVVVYLIAFLIGYSAIMIYLGKHGKLLPLGAFFEKYYVNQ